jgi:Carbohydrate-binding family 9
MLVPRAEFSIEEPWAIPRGCTPVALRRATDGAAPRLATRLALYHDGECLTALFLGEDDGVCATYLGHDEPLWKEDVVELFLAPEQPGRYFEIEVNPLGTTFDAVIDSPDLDRATMTTDLAWTCRELFAAVRTTPASLDVLVRVPFASLGARAEGEWRANFYRIDRGGGDEYSAWQPTMKTPADFHVPRAFGGLRFA